MKHKKPLTKLLALVLCLTMALGLLPITAMAYDPEYESETHTVFLHTEQTLAPGITQYTNYAYMNDGQQVVYYVTKTDLSRDDVVAQVAYKDMQCDVYGLDKLSNMVACANAKYSDPSNPEFISENYKVVSATNGDGYNMSTGEPGGAFVMNYQVKKGFAGQFLAIMYDGTARMGYTQADWDAFEAENNGRGMKEVIDIFGSELVRNGQDVTANASGSYNTDRHSRTMIGITEDGCLLNIVVDGRQAPFSDGASMHELAQIMLEAGAYNAFNLDGGGSTTYMMKPEGANECVVANRPSDGSERSISNGFIIASTAAPSDAFDHAVLTAEELYVTPGSSVAVSAIGVSNSGDAAELPAEGLSWQLADPSLGSVDANGLFTSSGAAGDAVVQLAHNGAVVGETTIHVVIPTDMSFDSETFTAPFGKTIDLAVTAHYGLNVVKLKDGDIQYTLSDEIGTIDGSRFTATSDTSIAVTSATVTAALACNPALTDTAVINIGKGSEVIYDFEDQDVSMFWRTSQSNYNYILTPGDCTLASVENGGHVHSGDYAMRMNFDFSTEWEGGYMKGLMAVRNLIDLKGVSRIGFWVYLSDEPLALNGRFYIREVLARNEDGSIKTLANVNTTVTQIDNNSNWNVGFMKQYEEPGWHYMYADLDTTKDWCIPANSVWLDVYISDRDNTEFNYNHFDYSGLNQDIIWYVDDITLDYSSAVDDRNKPVLNSFTYATSGMSDAAVLTDDLELAFNTVSFAAKFSDYAASNTSGLNAASAKAYIDGKEVEFSYNNGLISIADAELNNGVHKVKFSIEDNMGNRTGVDRTVVINGSLEERSVVVVPHSPSYGQIELGTVNGEPVYVPDRSNLDGIKLGSLYYVDLVPTERIEDVREVVVDLDLNNNSTWEPDHMVVADGFEASYEWIDREEELLTITVTRTGDSADTGRHFLVSIPARAYEMIPYRAVYGHADTVWMYPHYKAARETWSEEVRVRTDRGLVTFTDAEVKSFSSSDVAVMTEARFYYNSPSSEFSSDAFVNWNGGHDHRPGYGKFYVKQKKTVTTQVGDAAPTSTVTNYNGWYGNVGTTVSTSTAADGTVTTVTTTIEDTAHYDNHVDAVAMDDAAPSCTAEGYTGRSYCAVCNSIVNWGETIPAVEHNYELSPKTLKFIISDNGNAQSPDLVFEGGIGYYYDNGQYKTFDTDPETNVLTFTNNANFSTPTVYWWFDGEDAPTAWPGLPMTYSGQNDYGENQFVFEMPENPALLRCTVCGELFTGVFEDGKTYFDGVLAEGWIEDSYYVDGEKLTGVQLVDGFYYDFGEDGVSKGKYTGLVDIDGVNYYAKFGVLDSGWYEIEGEWYYFLPETLAGADGAVKTPDKVTFEFDNGRVLDGVWVTGSSGIIRYWYGPSYYKITSKNVPYLVQEIHGQIYLFAANGAMQTGIKANHRSNETTKIWYDCGTDGAASLLVGPMLLDYEGKTYYVDENGESPAAGLIQLDGDYYYVIYDGSIKKDGDRYVSEEMANGLMPAGTYHFGPDGKMVLPEPPELLNGIYDDYYYEDGVVVKDKGLVLFEGDYYYVIYNGKIKKDGDRVVTEDKTNGLMPAGKYHFGPDGKMVLPEPPEMRTGVYDGYYYEDGVIVKNKGVVLFEGDYYYVIYSGAIKRNGDRVVTADKTNGLLEPGKYHFNEEGKMDYRVS